MKRRILCLLLTVSLLASLLAGCASNAASSDPDTPDIDLESAEEIDFEDVDSYGPDVDLGPLLDEGVPLADAPALSTMLTPTAPGTAKKAASSATIDYSNAKDGYVMVKWSGSGSAKVKVLIKGPNAGKGVYDSYQYNLRTDGTYEAFPLSDGSGKYTIGVYQNTSGTKYATVVTAAIDINLADQFAPFIRPNQYVTYSADSEAVKKAAELCAGVTSNLDKVEKVYTFVVNNVTYDKQKAQTVKTGYLPNVDDTLKTKKGICFDYAALMSAMLRSQGVPVKLIVGYTGSVYHSWINVWSETEGWIEAKIYFDGKQWKLMDPTFASSGKQSDSIMQYIGNGGNYSPKYQY